jgi:hypothetical protein
MLKIDGFDGALIGISTVWQRVADGSAKRVDTLIYDGDVIVTILMHQSGMSEEEAIEYISYRIEGVYVGENTPVIVWPCTMKSITDMADEKDE